MNARKCDMVNALDEIPEPTTGSQSAGSDVLSYRKLRAPRRHQESLQIPPLTQCELHPLPLAQRDSVRTETFDFAELSRSSRIELVERAARFSSRYRAVASDLSTNAIIMAGHQPTLFHPGVWFKNFSLDYLGKKLNATPVNLIVDNDICNSALMRIPKLVNDRAQVETAALDEPGLPIPFEMRRINDLEKLTSFASRAANEIHDFVDQPIIERLWEHLSPAQNEFRLGQTLATARHALEAEYGMNTLEIPLGHIASTRGFALFVLEILTRMEEFHGAYNNQLKRYRKIHRIRSRSHPVPELGQDGEWSETPFWVWSKASPMRSGLFVRPTSDGFELSNRKHLQLRLSSRFFVDQLLEANERQEFMVRPRALMTTMYSRLVLSDQFLHGIGGAKYDQLTDAIACQFFGVQLPAFVTLTATMKLPTPASDIAKGDLTAVQTMLRELEFHPEVFIEKGIPGADKWIDVKRQWLATGVSEGSNKKRHEGIAEANKKLQPFVDARRDRLQQELGHLKSQFRNSQILRSREYSFSLFPESLVAELKAMLTD